MCHHCHVHFLVICYSLLTIISNSSDSSIFWFDLPVCDSCSHLSDISSRAPQRNDGYQRPLTCEPAIPVSDGSRVHIGDSVIYNCSLPCNIGDSFFGVEQRRVAQYMIGVTAIVCLLSSLFTVATFLVDMSRFRYPQRPIIFISGCYCVVAIAYLVGFTIGNQIACVDVKGQSVQVVRQGTQYEGCTIIFMLLYFFSMASSIWWVVLTITWFLSAGLKWGNEAIERHAHYFHLAAWTIPAAKTIVLLAFGQIDGDPLAGVCVAGGTDVWWLRALVLAPLCVYLGLGICFLLAGFVALCRIRTVMKHGGSRVDKLERLMVRISIYSVLYTVPAIVVIVCYFYEQASRASWLLAWHQAASPARCQGNCSKDASSMPEFTVFMIKYLMALIVGIMSGFWIWSSKTLSSWRRFCCVIVCRNSEPSAI